MQIINSLLIANRGEIARRIIKSCRSLGIKSIVVYSDPDINMPFVHEADIAIALQGIQAADTYLNIDKILKAAARSGADAIHPGYGFLSENAAFARSVIEAGLIWVGPQPQTIEKMGLKAAAKAIAEQEGVPTIPGYKGEAQDLSTLIEKAQEIGFPLLLKASAGGGGKGMRIVEAAEQLSEAILSAQREAQNSFGNPTLLLEKYFPSARHIEIQVLGDKYGHCVHLLERECSIQRRYQKIIEESPSPVLSDTQREEMGQAALKLCRAIGYDNAGTVEFIYTPQGQFYFLEVNTRLQVEHPVTEAVTGINLVDWQIRIAEGQPLSLQQEDIKAKGYALEARLYAENPLQNFMPATGTICDYSEPCIEGLRFDSGVEQGLEVGVYYDPMLAKIIAYGPDRPETIRRMRYALSKLRCQGLVTNQRFLLALMSNPYFQTGDYDTHFLSQRFSVERAVYIKEELLQEATIALLLYRSYQRHQKQALLPNIPLAWRNNFYKKQEEHYLCEGTAIETAYHIKDDTYHILIGDKSYQASIILCKEQKIRLTINGLQCSFFVAAANKLEYFVQGGNTSGSLAFKIRERYPKVEQEKQPGGYDAHIPGEIFKVLVETGQEVAEGTPLLVLLSMKMENTIIAEEAGVVEEIFVQESDIITAGTTLLKISVY